MIVVHAYYTAGMHDLAKLFVESFSYYHMADEVPLVITALDIDNAQRRELVDLYPWLTVDRGHTPMDLWAKECRVSVKQLAKWRKEIEGEFVNSTNKVWKLLTAGGDRVRRVRQLIQTVAPAHEPSLLVHFDIDTLFRGSILPIDQEMKGYDIGVKLRRNINPVKARITIDMMALRRTPCTMAWLDYWVANIAAVAPMDRPQGFGQSSCWDAFITVEAESTFKVLTLPLKYGLPGRNRGNNVLWNGNVHKLKKDDCVALFRKELDRLRGS